MTSRTLHVVFAFLLLIFLLGCGSNTTSTTSNDTTNNPPTQTVSVSVSPATATVTAGSNSTTAFTATVTGSTNTAVTWSVSGSGCSGAACGTITSAGVYTPPATAPTPNTVTVTATSQADTSKTGSATVTINPAGTPPAENVTVSPTSKTLSAGATQDFTANVAVNWTLSGANCTGAACGTLSSASGATTTYTAPATAPSPDNTVTLTATSQADATKTATATITITAPATVTLTPTSTGLNPSATQDFTANTAVNWTLSGANCTGADCGTLSSASGTSTTYTAPATTPNPDNTVILTATSQADPSKTATAAITVYLPGAVEVSISPGGDTLLAGSAGVQFTALVSDATLLLGRRGGAPSIVPGVTWSVTGPGTIDSAGLYTPPATLSTTSTVLVTATAKADGATTRSAVVTVSGSDNQNSKLAGRYAFQFTGFDANGPVTAAGSLSMNGTTGAITGVEDYRVEGGASPATSKKLSVTGTYVVMPAGTGNSRGSMTLVTSLGKQTYRFALDSAGNARLVEFDDAAENVLRGTGVLMKQTSANFNLASLAGSYSMLLTAGNKNGASTARAAVAGRFDVDSGGGVSNAIVDLAETDTALNQGGPTTGLSATATLGDTSALASVGRFEVRVTPSGVGSANFACYVVSAGRWLMMDIDTPGSSAPPAFTGVALAQSGTYDVASVPSTGVFQLTGYDVSASTTEALANNTVGLLVTDGAGALQTGSILDQNSDGAVVTEVPMTGTYTMTANGRGTLDYTAGSITGTFIVYMYGANSAFLLDASTSTSHDVQTGTLEAQTGSPFDAASVAGTFSLGSLPGVTRWGNGPNGWATLDGSSAWTAVVDQSSGSTSASSVGLPDVPVSGTYAVSSNGRGTLDAQIGQGTLSLVFYAVSPYKAYVMDAASSSAKTPVIVIDNPSVPN